MKITAQDLLRFGVIDEIVTEPAGGAHRDPAAMIAATGDAIEEAFNDLRNLDPDDDPRAAPAEVPRYRPQAGLNGTFSRWPPSGGQVVNIGLFRESPIPPQLGPDLDL